jgi:hypothetical protein
VIRQEGSNRNCEILNKIGGETDEKSEFSVRVTNFKSCNGLYGMGYFIFFNAIY